MSVLLACLLVLAGGFVGGIGRYALSGFVGRRVGETFPWGTLVVNISGALAIGIFIGLARRPGSVFAHPLVQDFLVFGLCGGYTTVSSFSLQTLNLALDGEAAAALGNIALSAGLCLSAVGVGIWAAQALAGA